MYKSLIAFVLFTCISCYQQERNCEKFKTGTFEFSTLLNGELQKTTFTRTDSIQIETYQNKNDTSKVRWINNCEFILTNLNPKNRNEEKPLHFKILTTDKNSYTFEYKLVGKPNKEKGTAIKIK